MATEEDRELVANLGKVLAEANPSDSEDAPDSEDVPAGPREEAGSPAEICRDLILFVKDEQVLYDPEHKSYKSNTQRNVAWALVGKKMNPVMTDKQARMKWASMLRSYKTERSSRKNGKTASENLQGGLFKYEQLKFLEDFIIDEEADSNAEHQDEVNKWKQSSEQSAAKLKQLDVLEKINELREQNGKFMDCVKSLEESLKHAMET